MNKIRVVIWNEFQHERTNQEVAKIYPNGIHNAIGDDLKKKKDFEVVTATLEDPCQGLPDELLEKTDVLIWWSHAAHHKVEDQLVAKIKARINEGMGFIPLHSSHLSKIFVALMGTSCNLRWSESGEKERLWVVNHSHPIVQGIGDYFELEHTEMYGERFDIPEPDQLLLISWFAGGQVFRSGCTWQRGNGKIFYFRPGHETFPIYYNESVMKVISNAVRWVAPVVFKTPCGDNMESLENI